MWFNSDWLLDKKKQQQHTIDGNPLLTLQRVGEGVFRLDFLCVNYDEKERLHIWKWIWRFNKYIVFIGKLASMLKSKSERTKMRDNFKIRWWEKLMSAI